MARGNKDLAAGFSDVATHNKVDVHKDNENDNNISTNVSTNNSVDTNTDDNIKNNNTNDNINDVNIDDENDTNNDYINNDDINVNNSIKSIAASIVDKPKVTKKRQISAYIDEDLIKELDKFGKKYGKGAKSELINNFLRTFFEK